MKPEVEAKTEKLLENTSAVQTRLKVDGNTGSHAWDAIIRVASAAMEKTRTNREDDRGHFIPIRTR